MKFSYLGPFVFFLAFAHDTIAVAVRAGSVHHGGHLAIWEGLMQRRGGPQGNDHNWQAPGHGSGDGVTAPCPQSGGGGGCDPASPPIVRKHKRGQPGGNNDWQDPNGSNGGGDSTGGGSNGGGGSDGGSPPTVRKHKRGHPGGNNHNWQGPNGGGDGAGGGSSDGGDSDDGSPPAARKQKRGGIHGNNQNWQGPSGSSSNGCRTWGEACGDGCCSGLTCASDGTCDH